MDAGMLLVNSTSGLSLSNCCTDGCSLALPCGGLVESWVLWVVRVPGFESESFDGPGCASKRGEYRRDVSCVTGWDPSCISLRAVIVVLATASPIAPMGLVQLCEATHVEQPLISAIYA